MSITGFLLLPTLIYSYLIIPVTISNYNIISIYTCIGTPDNCSKCRITFKNSILSVFNEFNYDYTKSLTSTLLENGTEYKGITDKIQLLNEQLQSIITIKSSYLRKYSKSSSPNCDIGLGPKTDSCLINQILNIANEKSIFYIDIGKSKLFLGDCPPQYYELQRFGIKTKEINMKSITQNKEGYRCELDSIYFKTPTGQIKHIIINKESNFSPSSNMIYVSMDLMDEIIEHYFSSNILNQTCKLSSDKRAKFIICNNDISNLGLSTITFIFGKISIKLDINDLFMTLGNNKYFMIAYYSRTTEFSLGFPFFNKYNIAFNINSKKISFVSKK